ncbi:hypothetical protein K8I31_05515, partial [bacterium]|nr:hypothetical protein [bacterium]
MNRIESIQLDEMSQTPPVTIEEASNNDQQNIQNAKKQAQQISLSLTDIQTDALENNLDLKVEYVSPQIAQQTLQEERAKFESAFVAGIQYNNSESPSSSQLQGNKTTAFSYQYGVQQPLQTGGELSIEQLTGQYKTDNQFSFLNPSFDTDLQFSFTQPLLRGAGIKTNTHSIRIAQYNSKWIDAQTKLRVIQILAEADRAYWRIYG